MKKTISYLDFIQLSTQSDICKRRIKKKRKQIKELERKIIELKQELYDIAMQKDRYLP